VAIVDGTFTSNMLPAGLTAIVAQRLGKLGSKVATFVGAGVQARINLDAVRLSLPIEEVRILSRTPQSADAFARHVSAQGLRPQIEIDPEKAIRGADVIVTSVPSSVGLRPFLDPAWVSPGALVSAVDVGRCWKPGFEAFDRMITDNREQAVVSHKEGRMLYGGRFDGDLPELVTGRAPGRQSPAERVAVIHPGDIVGVFGITLEIFKAFAGGK
jgi:ornithine cyclodeaminase/alanine dehydrogenase-like protein (mu-crystallin family)